MKNYFFLLIFIPFYIHAQNDPYFPSNSVEGLPGQAADFTNRLFQAPKNLEALTDPYPGSNLSTRDLFDLEQKFDSTYFYTWDTITEAWIVDFKYHHYVYNASNRVSSFEKQDWTGNSWVNANQFNYVFDVNQDLTTSLYKSWNGNTWENYYQSFRTYDANHNEISIISQYWDGSTWINSDQQLFAYDANHNVISQIIQLWDGAYWENYDRSLNAYNLFNERTKSIYQQWDAINEGWINKHQILDSFDTNNRHISKLIQNWNSISWENSGSNLYTYDNNGDIIRNVIFDWDGTQWINDYQYENTYDNSHNLISILAQFWVISQWKNDTRTTNSYDANNQLLRSLEERWNGTTWLMHREILDSYGNDEFITGESYKYYDDKGDFIASGDSTHYFFSIVVGTTDVVKADASLTVSPNPTSGKFTLTSEIGLGSVTIYNSIGERVYFSDQTNGQAKRDINLTGYSGGLYMAIVKNGENTTTRKIIIQ